MMGGGLREDREDSGQKTVLGPQHSWSSRPRFDSVSVTPLPMPLTKTLHLPELSLFSYDMENVPCLAG